MINRDEFDEELEEFELRLERLRALYEQYFLGMERIEPHVARKDVDRRAWKLKRLKQRNTAKRFKLNMLIQRYNTLQQYWMKVCRQIENGTYTRHLQRAERRFGVSARRQRKSLPPPDDDTPDKSRQAVDDASNELARMLAGSEDGSEAQAGESGGQVSPERSPAQGKRAPTQTKLPTRQQAPPPRRARDASLSDDRVKSLYGSLMNERKKLNQGGALSEAALAKSLRATEARLKKKYAGKKVDFKVSVQGGKAVIKPIVS